MRMAPSIRASVLPLCDLDACRGCCLVQNGILRHGWCDVYWHRPSCRDSTHKIVLWDDPMLICSSCMSLLWDIHLATRCVARSQHHQQFPPNRSKSQFWDWLQSSGGKQIGSQRDWYHSMGQFLLQRSHERHGTWTRGPCAWCGSQKRLQSGESRDQSATSNQYVQLPAVVYYSVIRRKDWATVLWKMRVWDWSWNRSTSLQ